ncbi:FepA family TonB-dependent siderophore receptor [Pantoea rwandensis]|uniref:Outer membrane receptor protein n=1 Tax=Pantoea rwandensis TaxID=1076550 RepID=A0A1X1D3C0_9GAMM|nr:FepA family TonB-dependent siderophore receptor [Pantoea rwandensis]ORM71182.1 outer membrane receptor protein [Pantoea rwandensis]
MTKLSSISLGIGIILGTISTNAFTQDNSLHLLDNDKNISDSETVKKPSPQQKRPTENTLEVNAPNLLRQQLGASTITSEDIRKNPPINDLSDIIRKMPGVNLTGNSTTGARGNNRQIDIRGMGPENTLILIDGNPVTSRNSVRYSWTGERDTRGDTNWVPAEMVDHIDVLRGPAAAHYGSGAMGGVVNIITKRPTNDWHGALNFFTNQPEDKKQGTTNRMGFNLSGALIEDVLTMRLYGNMNKTKGDAVDINKDANANAAGREGVRNRDINLALSWKPTATDIFDLTYSYSRQGNIYAGDSQYANGRETYKNQLIGSETNRMYRQAYNLTYNGIFDWGQSKTSMNFERTLNSRLNEGLTGGVEGMITSPTDFVDSSYNAYRFNEELTIPFTLLLDNTLTAGVEMNREELHDPASMSMNATGLNIDGVSGLASQRTTKTSQNTSAIYLEDSIVNDMGSVFIPGLRFDYGSKFGSNLSPSLNISQEITENLKLKAGIAKVFKSPNLYQISEGYLLSSRGNGCAMLNENSCYLMGNEDLSAETSVNKEIGLQWTDEDFETSLTFFRNDYQNKIVTGDQSIGTVGNYDVYRWMNGGKALVQGLEGSLEFPVYKDVLKFRTNATYMLTSKSKKTGNPLSLVPKYTINSFLDWNINDSLSANLSWSSYGRVHPKSYPDNEKTTSVNKTEQPAYSIFNIGFDYSPIKNVDIGVGVTNFLDKKLYRSSEGAQTFNQPGREFYGKLSLSF